MTNADISWPRRTQRLTLRPVTNADIDVILTYRNDPDVQRWLLRTTVDPERFRSLWLASVDDPWDHSCVAVADDGRVVGTGLLQVGEVSGQDGGPEDKRVEAELGYILDPAHAGHGYATELAADLLSLAFDELGLRRVTARCYADNTASRRVLDKIGMRLEQYGVKDSWHAELGWIDRCTYALLREEWVGR